MNKFRKLIIIASVTASSVALSSCFDNDKSIQYVDNIITQLSETVKQDMIDVGMDIYHLKLSTDYYTTTGDKGEFLSLPSASIIHDITQGKQLAYISYLISEDDYNIVKNLVKSERHSTTGEGYWEYTGDFEKLIEVVNHDTSTLYSVKNMTTNKMIYSYEEAKTEQKNYNTTFSSNVYNK